MIYSDEVYDENGLIKQTTYDTTAQTVTLFEEGVIPVPITRPMTPEESATWADREAADIATTNTATMESESDESVDKLIAVVEALNVITDMTNAEINANPAAVIKDLARECKTIARQVNREARITSGRTESTDTGTVTDV